VNDTYHPKDGCELKSVVLGRASSKKKAVGQRDDARRLLVIAYNSGYMAGHNDTVEAQFIPIHHSDMDTYHADVVEEILKENDKGEIPT
jgi:hypothetical protein